MTVCESEIHPLLDLSASPLRRAPAYARVEGKSAILGNGFIELRIDYRQRQSDLAYLTNKISDENIELEFSPFEAWFDCGRVSGMDGAFGAYEVHGAGAFASLTTHVKYDWLDADLSFVVRRGYHFLEKRVVLHNLKQKAFLERISLCKQKTPRDCALVIHDGGIYYPIVFVRGPRGSLFYCGEYPGYFVTPEQDRFAFEYYPGEWLEPGRSFQTLPVHMCVAQLTGRARSNPFHETGVPLDIGERQWFREYLLLGAKPRELPFIELKGPSQGIEGVSDLELINQCKWLGARHVFIPRMMKSIESYPLNDTLKRRLRQEALSAALVLNRDEIPNLHWVALGPDGGPAGPDFGSCFACEPFRDALVDEYLETMDQHGFSDVELTGAPIVACHNAGHGHAPGIESIQKAFEGLADVSEALRERCGHVRCNRPYGSYGAGITRLFDSIPLLASEHPLPLPDIHIGRLFADMGRLYFRRSHDFLVPKSQLTNSVGLVPEACPDAPYPGAENYPWYLYHDSIGWRYSLVSALATGLRHRFQALPHDVPEEDRAFARQWLDWERGRIAQLMEVEEIGEEPGFGHVDGYSYATARGATVFLFNTSYDPHDIRLKLCLTRDSDYVAREVYPREMNYLGPNQGLFRRDSGLDLSLRPKEARIIVIVRRSPASARRKRPEVFGLESRAVGNVVEVSGEPGTRMRVGIRVKGDYKETTLRMPGTQPTTHITDWVCTERTLNDGLGTLIKGAFPGTRFSPTMAARRNVWLASQIVIPKDAADSINVSPFRLDKPCWTYPDRLFFVVRFEPEPAFDPIRTSSQIPGVPEAYMTPLPMKSGVDLTPLHLGLRAWINEAECCVHPAIAAWSGLMPNPYPIVAYFFEAGTKLRFGRKNHVVLFVNNFDPAAFRGIYIEHFPELRATRTLDV